MRNILTLAALYLITIVTFANATDHGSSTLPNIVDETLINFSLGAHSLSVVTSGNNNICFGEYSCSTLTTGTFNTIIQNASTNHDGLTTGSNNVFIGYGAASAVNTTAAIGIGIGNFLGNDDIGIGNNALSSGTTGTGNIGIGTYAFLVTSTGSNGIALGYYSMYHADVSTDNIGIGAYSGSTLTSGINNVMIGDHVASTTLTTGSYNILIGTSAAIDATTSSVSNEIHIGGTGGDWVKVTGANTNSSEITIENGVHIFSGALSSVTSGATDCGTSPSIVGNDNAGLVTAGTSPSGKCTVTFAAAKTTAPICMCQNNTSNARGCGALTVTTSTMALTATTSPYTAADKIAYHCFGYQK